MKKSISCLLVAGMAAGLFLATPMVNKAEPKTVSVSQVHDYIGHVETLQQLDDIIANNDYVAVDISTTWCGSCKEYAPVFKAVAEKYKDDVVFCKVVLDQIPNKKSWEIIKSYKVSYVPKTMLFKDGKEVFNTVGYMDEKELSSLVDKYLLGK